ncbi:hypothetical protein O181_023339 [Austropuccinia psidii MF-1]|uniref:C3HC-type domain-containing protein n=1 Tax=Austropuccinia psidii MF-1 TaxID=1389203 RepID=A0A9Q3GYK0_9BASI|nr:hypothetical protein [Austropuccinia psidii MF-1]
MPVVSFTDSELRNAIIKLDMISDPMQPLPLASNTPSAPSLSNLNQMTSTPALEALRSKTRQKPKRPSLSNSHSNKSPLLTTHSSSAPSGKIINTSHFHPNSQKDFLKRLSTFRLSSYSSSKPSALSPSTMAAFGWSNVQKNRLKCQDCQASWALVIPLKDKWSTSTGSQILDLGKQMRVNQHRPSCPWRTRRSPTSIYHIPFWKTTKAAIDDLSANALQLAQSFFIDSIHPFEIQSPLDDQSISTLSACLQMLPPNPSIHQTDSVIPISALILALFGWIVKPLPAHTKNFDSTRRLSLNSQTSSSSISILTSSQPAVSTQSLQLSQAHSTTQNQPTLYCNLCFRQALIPTLSSKPFDVVLEHRNFCPYVDSNCGFDPSELPPNGTLLKSQLGWQKRFEVVKNFIKRKGFEQVEFSTLENILKSFDVIQNHPSYPGLSSSPQLSVLNFVKSTLS